MAEPHSPLIKISMDLARDEAPLAHILQEPHDWSRDRKWISYGFPLLPIESIAGEGKPFQFIATQFMTTGAGSLPIGNGSPMLPTRLDGSKFTFAHRSRNISERPPVSR